ncbi:MAG: DUF669 domain-containing protein, partial [Phycisphaerae bacterium]|nr:DUF669 domain-containing protein [Phycisphaerae bacterium]
MANLNGFNANEVEPTKELDPIPAGKYLAAITASEMKAIKSGSGNYLELEFTVLEGEFKGRKVRDRLCLNHPKDIAQKMARGNLSAICRAVGVLQPRDSVELHNLPLVISVKCKRREDSFEIDNVVKGYSSKSEAKSTTASQPQQAPANDTTPP